MSKYEVVSKTIHSNKNWRPFTDFLFASGDLICPIALSEITKAVLDLPIAFTQKNENIELCVVLGVGQKRNYLVDEEGGWTGKYVPAIYRSYPFGITNDDLSLCIEGSNLCSPAEGEMIFNKDGEPTERIKNILGFLSGLHSNMQLTNRLCSFLYEEELIEPWTIQINNDDGQAKIEGLFRINEKKFNSLESEKLLEVRDKGALPLIFCQLLSMQNLEKLVNTAYRKEFKGQAPEELPFDMSNDNGSLNFDGFS